MLNCLAVVVGTSLGGITLDQACRSVPCQHQWCSNMPSLMGNQEVRHAIGLLICSTYSMMCSSTIDCWEQLLDLPGHLCRGEVWWSCAAWTSRSRSRLYGACVKAPLLVYWGCAWEMPQFSGGDGTSKFCTWGCAIMCRLAGMKLDKGILRTGEPPEAKMKGPTCILCVCGTPLKALGRLAPC